MAENRHSLDTYTPLQIEHEQRIDNRLSLRMGVGTDLTSQESIMLRTAFQTKHLYKLRPISVQRISCIFVQTKKIADVLQGCKTQAIVSVSVYK